MPPRRLSVRWAWALLCVLAPARAARAQEATPVEVRVEPGGQSWSIGEHGGFECSPSCTLHLPPRSYHIKIGDTSEDVLIDVPSEVEYRPAIRPLRYTGFALVVAGATTCGMLLYIAVKSAGCRPPSTSCTSSSGAAGLAAVAAGAFLAGVAGGFMAYFGGESIRVRDLPQRRASQSFTFDVSGQGASVGWALAF